MTLRELLEGAAVGLGDVSATPSADGGTIWSAGPTAFAALDGEGASAEFHLDPAIAAAAVRTPDTAPSSRGPGWVRFRPPELDSHAVDRATAWFVSAYRRTGRA